MVAIMNSLTASAKTVVIGAGLAGLTTAYRLQNNDIDVDIYEARSRVGGRVHTVLVKNMDGAFSHAELGAQNITDGGEAKHILGLINELQLPLKEDDIPFNGVFYDDERFYDRNQLVADIVAANPNIQDKINQLAKAHNTMQVLVDDLQLTSAQKSFISFIMNAYEGLPLSGLSTNIHNVNTLQHMLSGGLSAAHAVSEENPTLHRISLKAGNATLPIRLAKELDQRLHLNKVLKEVKINERNQYVLIFSDGEIVICSKLVLAIPCTVYKNIKFDPRIINKKQLMRIQAIPYATTAKILMPIKQHGPSGHWVSTSMMGAFFNDDQKLLNLYYIHDDGKLLHDRVSYDRSLQVVKAGFSGATLNLLPVVEASDTNYSEYDAPVAKSWVNDPYALGSYSAFDTSEGHEIDKRIHYQGIIIKALFAPINDRIFFVGEHASIIDEIGTMEAAVESGERIAKLLTKLQTVSG